MILVDEAEAAEEEAKREGNEGKGKAALALEPVSEPDTTTPEGVRAALASMGFVDASMVEAALVKHGSDLAACAQDLANVSEWGHLLDDLEEMGFGNRELNKALMLKHDGNVKRTVKAPGCGVRALGQRRPGDGGRRATGGGRVAHVKRSTDAAGAPLPPPPGTERAGKGGRQPAGRDGGKGTKGTRPVHET